MKKQRIFTLLALGTALGIILAVLFLLAQQGIGLFCPFYQLTGLQCPGCGNSRAALALLRLDLISALRYNLLFPLEFGYLLWVVLSGCGNYLQTGRFHYQPKRIWIDTSVLVLVVIWGILRNLL